MVISIFCLQDSIADSLCNEAAAKSKWSSKFRKLGHRISQRILFWLQGREQKNVADPSASDAWLGGSITKQGRHNVARDLGFLR